MSEENFETVPLEELAERIVQKANDADDRIIEAALLVREARARVEKGEAGEVTWYEWAPKNIGLSPSRLRELQRIAEAEAPRQELERQRRLIRARVEKHREKKRAEPPAPLRNGGERPTEAIVQPQEGRQKSSSDGQDRDEDHHIKPKGPAPLRNGGAQIRANAEIEKDRQRLIAWAQQAQLEQIEEVLFFIDQLAPAEADSHLVEPAAPAAA